jgi:hypothetical protein
MPGASAIAHVLVAVEYARWLAGLEDTRWPRHERPRQAAGMTEGHRFARHTALVTGGGRGDRGRDRGRAGDRAREWAALNVRVNAVCPGYVETDLTAKVLANDAIRTSLVGQTPMRRLAEMDEVVAPTRFRVSDEASSITGAALLVDGGFAA